MAQNLDAYYDARGWDCATGMPTRAKLEELDLNDVAAVLEAEGIPPFPRIAVPL